MGGCDQRRDHQTRSSKFFWDEEAQAASVDEICDPKMRQIVSREGSLEVNNMDEEETVSLLLQSVHLDENLVELMHAATPIVKELYYLPLAVVKPVLQYRQDYAT